MPPCAACPPCCPWMSAWRCVRSGFHLLSTLELQDCAKGGRGGPAGPRLWSAPPPCGSHWCPLCVPALELHFLQGPAVVFHGRSRVLLCWVLSPPLSAGFGLGVSARPLEGRALGAACFPAPRTCVLFSLSRGVGAPPACPAVAGCSLFSPFRRNGLVAGVTCLSPCPSSPLTAFGVFFLPLFFSSRTLGGGGLGARSWAWGWCRLPC